MKNFKNIISEAKIIIAVKNIEDLATALKAEEKIIFLLCGSILNIEEITRKIRAAGKSSFVHTDMIAGFDSKDTLIIDFLKENSYTDGIISTKPTMLKYAKKRGLLTVQRCFLIDSLSYVNSVKMIREAIPDAVEILPGVMPKILKKISEEIPLPIIAGGLIFDKEDIEIAFSSGVTAISTTKKELW